MTSITFPRGYNQQGYIDVETFELPDKTLRHNVVHFCYESKIAGKFPRYNFHTTRSCSQAFINDQKAFFSYDYLPKSMGNEIDQSTGLIRPQRRKKSKEDVAFENVHWDLATFIQ